MTDCKGNKNLTLESAGIRLQKIQALMTLQLNHSDPLYALSDCKKYSEITVGKRTQWKPAVFAVKRFAVYSLKRAIGSLTGKDRSEKRTSPNI